MSISPVEYLRHVLDETDFLEIHFGGVSKEEFLNDDVEARLRSKP